MKDHMTYILDVSDEELFTDCESCLKQLEILHLYTKSSAAYIGLDKVSVCLFYDSLFLDILYLYVSSKLCFALCKLRRREFLHVQRDNMYLIASTTSSWIVTSILLAHVHLLLSAVTRVVEKVPCWPTGKCWNVRKHFYIHTYVWLISSLHCRVQRQLDIGNDLILYNFASATNCDVFTNPAHIMRRIVSQVSLIWMGKIIKSGSLLGRSKTTTFLVGSLYTN